MLFANRHKRRRTLVGTVQLRNLIANMLISVYIIFEVSSSAKLLHYSSPETIVVVIVQNSGQRWSVTSDHQHTLVTTIPTLVSTHYCTISTSTNVFSVPAKQGCPDRCGPVARRSALWRSCFPHMTSSATVAIRDHRINMGAWQRVRILNDNEGARYISARAKIGRRTTKCRKPRCIPNNGKQETGNLDDRFRR